MDRLVTSEKITLGGRTLMWALWSFYEIPAVASLSFCVVKSRSWKIHPPKGSDPLIIEVLVVIRDVL